MINQTGMPSFDTTDLQTLEAIREKRCRDIFGENLDFREYCVKRLRKLEATPRETIVLIVHPCDENSRNLARHMKEPLIRGCKITVTRGLVERDSIQKNGSMSIIIVPAIFCLI